MISPRVKLLFIINSLLLPTAAFAEIDVGSRFNIYGNLFGWQVFDLMYEFMKGTGLILIPFLIFLYNAYMARDEGNRYDPVSALISIELKVYVAVAMMLIFLIPTVSVSKVLFIYKEGASQFSAGNTKTTFDQYDSTLPTDVRIPVGWYAILYASSGFSNSMKTMLPTGEHAKQLMYQLQQANMTDPGIQKNLNDFERRCAVPGRGRLNVIMKDHPSSQIAKAINAFAKSTKSDIDNNWWSNNAVLGNDYWKISPVYPGNEVFKKWLYKDGLPYCVSIPPPAGKDMKYVEDNNLCMPGTGSPVNPVSGKTCGEMWSDIKSDLNSYYSKTFTEYAQNDDAFIYGRMTSGKIDVGTKGAGDQEGGYLQKASEFFSALGLNIGSLFKALFQNIIRFYLPIMLGVITMFFIMLLPILVTFSRYNLSTLAGIGITFFGISFLPSIWHIAAWFDQVMIMAVYGSKGLWDGLFSLERAVLDIITLLLYVVFTYLWIGFVRHIGGSATRTLHQALAGGSSEVRGSWGSKGQNVSRGRSAGNKARNMYNKSTNSKK